MESRKDQLESLLKLYTDDSPIIGVDEASMLNGEWEAVKLSNIEGSWELDEDEPLKPIIKCPDCGSLNVEETSDGKMYCGDCLSDITDAVTPEEMAGAYSEDGKTLYVTQTLKDTMPSDMKLEICVVRIKDIMLKSIVDMHVSTNEGVKSYECKCKIAGGRSIIVNMTKIQYSKLHIKWLAQHE